MFIKIKKELLLYLSQRNMRIDDLFVIFCYCLNKTDLLNTFLSDKNNDQKIAFMQSLIRKGLMVVNNIENFSWDNYTLTVVGYKVYEDCITYVSENTVEIINQSSNTIPGVVQTFNTVIDDSLNQNSFDQLVSEFVALFPDNTRNMSGEKLKSHPADIKKKMKDFIKKYGYEKEVILNATRRYLEKQSRQGYAYCNQAHYFISKDGVSKLAAECEHKEIIVEPWENVL